MTSKEFYELLSLAQAGSEIVAVMDPHCRFDAEEAARYGVELCALLVSQPSNDDDMGAVASFLTTSGSVFAVFVMPHSFETCRQNAEM